MEKAMRFLPAGDRALVVEFGSVIDDQINDQVQAAAALINSRKDPAVDEVVPTFCSLLVHYRPEYRKYRPMCEWIAGLLESMELTGKKEKRILKVPVCYGARFGADLHDMEKLLHLDMDEIIALHSKPDYKIYMLGFLPGFVYLGGLDERIACPRLPAPRVRIAPGAVGIGGSQTGIYPLASPGGWRLIGQTPIDMYDPNREQPILVKAGDYIRFQPVGLLEWYDIKRAVTDRTYSPEIVIEREGSKPEIVSNAVHAYSKNRKTECTGQKPDSEAKTPAMRLTVVSPGAMTTVQDAGRFGSQNAGMTQSGAMDQAAYRLANRLVENEGGEAVLEMTVSGISFTVEGKGLIAVTGADMKPMLNGEPMPLCRAVEVKTGDSVEMGFASGGCRSYLAVSGGIDVPVVMGSRSTNLKCHLGGYEGRPLKAGDVLTCSESPIVIGHTRAGAAWKPYEESVTLRFVPGPQDDMFAPEAIRTFEQASYRVNEKSDRMGYRLDGPAIQAKGKTDIISDGIVFGSIQVPNDGKPIILMADHQTTGGYAKIGTVVSEDLPKLAQLMPGGKIRFSAVSVDEIQQSGGYSSR